MSLFADPAIGVAVGVIPALVRGSVCTDRSRGVPGCRPSRGG